jgi:hypothetical protein
MTLQMHDLEKSEELSKPEMSETLGGHHGYARGKSPFFAPPPFVKTVNDFDLTQQVGGSEINLRGNLKDAVVIGTVAQASNTGDNSIGSIG